MLATAPHGGCLDDRCDPGQHYDRGRCLVVEDATSGEARPDISLADGDADPMGAPCSTTEACVAPANVCAMLPDKPAGYCSIEGCSPSAKDCPKGFVCQDLSGLVPDQPPLCLLTCNLDDPVCPASHVCSDLSLVLGGLPPICFPE